MEPDQVDQEAVGQAEEAVQPEEDVCDCGCGCTAEKLLSQPAVPMPDPPFPPATFTVEQIDAAIERTLAGRPRRRLSGEEAKALLREHRRQVRLQTKGY